VSLPEEAPDPLVLSSSAPLNPENNSAVLLKTLQAAPLWHGLGAQKSTVVVVETVTVVAVVVETVVAVCDVLVVVVV
jgi:hypothetical protein